MNALFRYLLPLLCLILVSVRPAVAEPFITTGEAIADSPRYDMRVLGELLREEFARTDAFPPPADGAYFPLVADTPARTLDYFRRHTAERLPSVSMKTIVGFSIIYAAICVLAMWLIPNTYTISNQTMRAVIEVIMLAAYVVVLIAVLASRTNRYVITPQAASGEQRLEYHTDGKTWALLRSVGPDGDVDVDLSAFAPTEATSDLPEELRAVEYGRDGKPLGSGDIFKWIHIERPRPRRRSADNEAAPAEAAAGS